MEVYKVDDVTANDVMQEKQHLLRKEIWFSFLRE